MEKRLVTPAYESHQILLLQHLDIITRPITPDTIMAGLQRDYEVGPGNLYLSINNYLIALGDNFISESLLGEISRVGEKYTWEEMALYEFASLVAQRFNILRETSLH